MSANNGDPRTISFKDIALVQHLIERCVQAYMSPMEIVNTLYHRAQIEPQLTKPVYQQLEKENKEFFEKYKKTLTVKDQIFRYNRLLERHAELMGRYHNRVGHTTLSNTYPNNYTAFHHQAPVVMNQTRMTHHGVVGTTFANGPPSHSMNNYSAYQYQAPGVASQSQMQWNGAYQHQAPGFASQSQMRQKGVVPTTLVNGSQLHSNFQHQVPQVMSQNQRRQNAVVGTSLAYGLDPNSMNNYSAYQYRAPEAMNQIQMGQHRAGPTTSANGLHMHSMNNYSAFQQQTPEVLSQSPFSWNEVVPTIMTNEPQAQSSYQHQMHDVLSQTPMSWNGVVPNIVTNESQTHPMSNFPAYQHHTPVVPFAASENIQHMTNTTFNYYADGAPSLQASMQGGVGMQGHTELVDVHPNMSLAWDSIAGGITNELNGADSQVVSGADVGLLEPYDEVFGEALVPPFNGGESTSMALNEALLVLEASSPERSGQMTPSFSFASFLDIPNNYPLSPYGKDGNLVSPQKDYNGIATTSTEGASSKRIDDT